MGKGVIVSNLGNAAYNVRVIKDVTRVDAAKSRCSNGIAVAETAMVVAEQAETNARALITAIGEQLDAAIVAAEGNSSDPVVLALQKKQNEAADKLESAQHDLAQAKLKKLSYEKELATYDGIAGEETRELWCADATDDLASGAEVGTVEINQETTNVLVAPGGAAADDILQPGMANDALATFLNWGILPGVQRHRPTYRLGTIKEIDYDADTAMVCLDDARSSAQNIKINPTGTPCEVQKDGPAGFVDFCASNPDHPACQANGSTQQSYSADLKATLDEINKRINESNTYAYDSEQYGKLEHWTEMRQYGDSGDCEDFALTKYRACLLAGIPASSLKLVTGKATNGQGHAWLEVQTDQGNVALDLNTQAATFSDELPYSARAVQADGANWSGKGLLLEDVPVKYMECHAAAFREDDRVVVHFKDSDWGKPEVIGFETEPKYCGISIVYRKSGAVRIATITVKPDGAVSISQAKTEEEIGFYADDHFQTLAKDIKLNDGTPLTYVAANVGIRSEYVAVRPGIFSYGIGSSKIVHHVYNHKTKKILPNSLEYGLSVGLQQFHGIDVYNASNSYAWAMAISRELNTDNIVMHAYVMKSDGTRIIQSREYAIDKETGINSTATTRNFEEISAYHGYQCLTPKPEGNYYTAKKNPTIPTTSGGHDGIGDGIVVDWSSGDTVETLVDGTYNRQEDPRIITQEFARFAGCKRTDEWAEAIPVTGYTRTGQDINVSKLKWGGGGWQFVETDDQQYFLPITFPFSVDDTPMFQVITARLTEPYGIKNKLFANGELIELEQRTGTSPTLAAIGLTHIDIDTFPQLQAFAIVQELETDGSALETPVVSSVIVFADGVRIDDNIASALGITTKDILGFAPRHMRGAQ